MKSLLISLLAFSFLVSSCKTTDSNYKQNLREIRYFKSTIHNIERKTLILADGSSWKTNRLVIAVNMTDVFFVVNFSGFGDAYINGTKYSVSHIGNGEGFRYFTGYLNSLKTTHAGNGIIELSDGTRWLVLNAKGTDIKNWLSTSDVIISEDETTMINPYKNKMIKVRKITDKIRE